MPPSELEGGVKFVLDSWDVATVDLGLIPRNEAERQTPARHAACPAIN